GSAPVFGIIWRPRKAERWKIPCFFPASREFWGFRDERLNSLFGRRKFPVPMRREFPRKPLRGMCELLHTSPNGNRNFPQILDLFRARPSFDGRQWAGANQ